MGSAYDCYTRVPYGSLIATVLCVVGVALFCSQMYNAVSYTLQMFNDTFQLKLYWADTLRTVFITLGCSMAVVALLLLVVGIASTGVTRDQVFYGSRARIGGTVSITVFMLVTYLLNLAWIGIFVLMVVVTFIYSTYSMFCDFALVDSVEIGRCISFKQVGFLFPNTSFPNFDVNRFTKCGNEYTRFCESIKNTQGIYLLACIASGIVVISLIHFLICLSSNYTHVQEGRKNKEIEYLRSLQEGELALLTKSRYQT